MSRMRTPTMHTAADGAVSWKVRFRDGRRQTSRTFERLPDAERFCGWIVKYGATHAADLLDGRDDATTDELTVRDLCTRHVDNLVGVTTGTIQSYRKYIERDLGALGPVPLSALDREAAKRWVKALADSGASGKTVKNKHNFVASVFNRAVIDGVTASNPFKGIRLPKTTKEPMTILTHDEFARFLGCFEPRWVPMIEVMFGTGLRFGELTALRPMDVDLSAGTISVTRAWKRGAHGPELGPPKSDRSRRTITLGKQTAIVLALACDGLRRDALIFTTSRGEPVRSSTFHGRVWQPALDLANGKVPMRPHGGGRPPRIDVPGRTIAPLDPPLGKRPRVHDARHSCASWLLDAYVPIHVVSAHLGHENITTTVNTYGHLLPSAQGYVRDALTLALSASRPELLA